MESLLTAGAAAALPLLPNKPLLGPRLCVLSSSSSSSSRSSSASPPPPPSLKSKPIIKTKTVVVYSNHQYPSSSSSSSSSILMKLQVPFASMMVICASPAAASEIASDARMINLESLLLSIDDFFNRNPFFVSALAFIWLVVIPLAQDYLSKCKSISAIDAFRKLRDDPNSQLLDIRDHRSLTYLPSPNLKILNKKPLQLSFNLEEGEEEHQDEVDDFVNKVLDRFKDPPNTTLCILDNFDGNSLRVAELLFKAGSFKEAYAIKDGLRGKDGWQAIQETMLPPSTHVFPNKNVKGSRKLEVNMEELKEETDKNGQTRSNGEMENGYIGQPISSSQQSYSSKRPLSPYPNYPDLRPPSSPTPSKPKD